MAIVNARNILITIPGFEITSEEAFNIIDKHEYTSKGSKVLKSVSVGTTVNSDNSPLTHIAVSFNTQRAIYSIDYFLYLGYAKDSSISIISGGLPKEYSSGENKAYSFNRYPELEESSAPKKKRSSSHDGLTSEIISMIQDGHDIHSINKKYPSVVFGKRKQLEDYIELVNKRPRTEGELSSIEGIIKKLTKDVDHLQELYIKLDEKVEGALLGHDDPSSSSESERAVDAPIKKRLRKK